MSAPAATARVTVLVEVAPEVAFEVFTQETDLWWRRGPRFRPGGRRPGVLTFEPGPQGRLFERLEPVAGTGKEPQVLEVGRVLAWEPPSRLLFEWRNTNFAPHEHTEVEVRFEASPSGTRVTVEHRGWEALRKDHPARHGLEDGPFLRMIGLWWGDLLTGLRLHAAVRAPQ